MSKLSLAIRKNVRDFTDHHKAALERLAVFIGGGPITLIEPDYNAMNEAVDSSYKDRVGEVVNWILEGFASNLEHRFRNDETFSGALKRVWTVKQISIKLGKVKCVDSSYHTTSLDKGAMVITCETTQIATNTELIGKDIIESLKLMGDGNIPYLLKKDIEKYQPEIDSTLQEIASVTGITGVSLDPVDFVKMNTIPPAEDYFNRMGEVVLWFIGGLKGQIQKLVADDMAKEALADVWKGPIELKYDPKFKDADEEFVRSGGAFVGGKLIITYRDFANVDYTGCRIERLL